MSYSKTNWQNLPNTNTPLNATNMNKLETQVKNNSDAIDGMIASGTTNGIYWVKYSDGTLIQCGNETITTGTTANSEGFTHYYAESTVNLPVAFANANSYVITANTNAQTATITTVSVNRSSGSSILLRLVSSRPSYERIVYWTAIGRWKA